MRKYNSNGLSAVGTLTLIFVVLKCTDLIEWSWLWVLSPVWMSFLLCLIIFLTALALMAASKYFRKRT